MMAVLVCPIIRAYKMLVPGARNSSVSVSAVGLVSTPEMMPLHELSGTARYAVTSYCLVSRVSAEIGCMREDVSKLGVLMIARFWSRRILIVISAVSVEESLAATRMARVSLSVLQAPRLRPSLGRITTL